MVFIDDDPAEIAESRCVCRTIHASSGKGIEDEEMKLVLSMLDQSNSAEPGSADTSSDVASTEPGSAGTSSECSEDSENAQQLNKSPSALAKHILQGPARVKLTPRTPEPLFRQLSQKSDLTLLASTEADSAGTSSVWSEDSENAQQISKSPSSKDVNEEEVTLLFLPGKLGLHADWHAGRLDRVDDKGQASKNGVRPGWIMTKVTGQAYSEQLLDECNAGTLPYRITFKKDSENARKTSKSPSSKHVN
jgi:hypothetical protein